MIITLVLVFVSVFALRANNEHMVKLRDAVYTADKDNGDVQGALGTLQRYVTSHMNTDLSGGKSGVYPPIQLKYTYDRLIQAESDELAKTNSSLYTEAQKYCEAQNPTGFYGATRLGCVTDYLTSHNQKHDIAPIPDALYKFDFVSPRWSPDLAGWSLVLAAISAAVCVISFVRKRLAK